MPSSAPAIEPSATPAISDSELQFYRTRDDFMRTYVPATDEERLLVTQIARAWLHLQKFYTFRDQIVAEKGLSGLFFEDYDRYKQLMRNLAEAERMWRYAVQELSRARRRPQSTASLRSTSVTAIRSHRPPVGSTNPKRNRTTPDIRPIHGTRGKTDLGASRGPAPAG